jgi:VanZ family protein
MTRLLAAGAPVLLWAGMILLLGSDDFSRHETSRFLGPLIAWLLPWLDEGGHDTVLDFVRKCAHVAEYGLLALLAWRAVLMTTRLGALATSGVAISPVVLLALVDEGRQAFSDARTGTGGDVLLDIAGGFGFLLLAGWARRRLGGSGRDRAEEMMSDDGT